MISDNPGVEVCMQAPVVRKCVISIQEESYKQGGRDTAEKLHGLKRRYTHLPVNREYNENIDKIIAWLKEQVK